jgi:hypothetical protein
LGVTTAFFEEGRELGPPPVVPLRNDVPSRKTWIGSRDPHDAALVRRETPAAAIPASRMGCAGDDTTEG